MKHKQALIVPPSTSLEEALYKNEYILMRVEKLCAKCCETDNLFSCRVHSVFKKVLALYMHLHATETFGLL